MKNKISKHKLFQKQVSQVTIGLIHLWLDAHLIVKCHSLPDVYRLFVVGLGQCEFVLCNSLPEKQTHYLNQNQLGM